MIAPASPEIPERDHEELVEILRALLCLRTVNPPGDEIVAARYLEEVFADVGLRPTVFEPFAGRGSIVVRLRGDGSGGDPLLLLSHLDVVPAPGDRWTHDPFGGDVADGYVWGRGAVDMKNMVAMEVEVVRRLAREARAAGRDPAADPIPGLRRDVVFASTADEEAGGFQGAGWLVDNHPELLRAAGALNEAGGIGMELAGTRFYPIQVAEKGFVVYRLTIHGTWGHGSVPREDNAAVLAARVIAALAAPGRPRLTPTMARFFSIAAQHLPASLGQSLAELVSTDPARSEQALRLCDPSLRRTAAALLRDTISPDVVHAGVKYNVIPGVAEVEVDCRVLPGTDQAGMTRQLEERLGEELWARVEPHVTIAASPVEAPVDDPLYRLLERAILDHDPAGVPLPVMAPFATDAKHMVRLGFPTYGFTPMQLAPGEQFLELFHGVDERVSLAALRFGLTVLEDVVRRFCG